MKSSNIIKASQLKLLIQEIISTVVKEINNLKPQAGLDKKYDINLDFRKVLSDKELINHMKDWVLDTFPDEEEDIHNMSNTDLLKGIHNTYAGGISGFILSDPLNNLEKYHKNQVSEITTTSAVSGYNIPGAFSNKLNRRDKIEVLGYEMTPEGKKEYNRPADRKI